MSKHESERNEIYDAVGKLNAYPFWLIQGDMEPEEPRVREIPHVWRFKDFEPLIAKAGPIVPHEMAERRPHTRLVTLKGDHFVHVQDPEGFTGAVRDFLKTLD